MLYLVYIEYALVFVSGLFIGSFLNLVSDRVLTDEGVFFGRSRCDHCKKPLEGKDLLPLLSYLLLRGKCRYCQKPLSIYYPISEILTGVVFVLTAIFIRIFDSSSVLSWLAYTFLVVVFGVYIVVFLTDLKSRIIPDKVVMFGVIFIIVYIVGNFIYGAYSSYNYLSNDDFGKYLIKTGYWNLQILAYLKNFGFTVLSAIGISAFFYLLIFITKGKGMGGGDAKLGFLIGLFNGFPLNIFGIFAGFLTGAVFSLVLIVLKKKSMKDTIAFGPFLVFGSTIAFFFGRQLLSWYLNILN